MILSELWSIQFPWLKQGKFIKFKQFWEICIIKVIELSEDQIPGHATRDTLSNVERWKNFQILYQEKKQYNFVAKKKKKGKRKRCFYFFSLFFLELYVKIINGFFWEQLYTHTFK